MRYEDSQEQKLNSERRKLSRQGRRQSAIETLPTERQLITPRGREESVSSHRVSGVKSRKKISQINPIHSNLSKATTLSKDEIETRNELEQTAVRDAVRKARNVPVSKRPKRQQLYYMYTMLMNRKSLEYTFTNSLRYSLWLFRSCRCCPCRSSKSLKELKAPKVDVYMNKAEKRLT